MASPVSADTDAAARLFRSASAAFARHDYREAAIDFEEAYRQAPHPATLFNAALAWEAASEPARAADAFAGALAEQGLDAEQTAQGRKKLDALEQQLGVIDVAGPAGAVVTLEHVRKGRMPASIHVAPGDHELLIEAPGGARKQTAVHVAAGERQRVRLDSEAPRPAASTPRVEPPRSGSPLRGRPADKRAWSHWRGRGLGVKAVDARDAFEASAGVISTPTTAISSAPDDRSRSARWGAA
jgi:hypothetical protein